MILTWEDLLRGQWTDSLHERHSLHERRCLCSIKNGGFLRHETLCEGALAELVVCFGVGLTLVVECGMSAENHAFLPCLLVC